jgi:two-component system alkaline phosphatase synthesis response regulator PhoP
MIRVREAMVDQTLILLVDDETSILDVVRYNLEKSNFQVITARDGLEALRLAQREKPDLILLDLMLPGLDGFEVCRRLRSGSNIPIIMLTARDEEVDRVVGLELGADDYVVKPFSTRELIARVKSVLRRTRTVDDPSTATLRVLSFEIDRERHTATWAGVALELSSLEFELLFTFLHHVGRVLSREQLLDQVWGYAYPGDTRAVDTAIKRLRQKLREVDPIAADQIETVRGVGYRVRAHD